MFAFFLIFTLHVHAQAGGYVIGAGVLAATHKIKCVFNRKKHNRIEVLKVKHLFTESSLQCKLAF